jgi:hypothetical protein
MYDRDNCVVIEGEEHIAQVFVDFDDAEIFADECDTCKVYKTEADLWNFAQVEFIKK